MMAREFFRKLGVAFTRKKKLESGQDVSTSLMRCLSAIDLTFIGVGGTIGAGIYVLTGDVAKNKSGPAIVFSFLIAAVASLLSGFCYGEFGARIPKAGSAYMYSYITLGELVGFFIGWNMLLEYIIGGASIARGLSAYIDSLAHGAIKDGTIFLIGEINVPFLGQYFDVFTLVLTLFFTVFLSTGVKDSARLNNACVVINLTTIVLVIIVGSFHTDAKNWDNFAPYGVPGIFSGAATCFFAFIGFDTIATASEEARNPAFSVPLSMALTIVICFLAYFGVSAVVTLMVPYNLLDENAAVANAFHQRGQYFMGHVIGVGATLGLSGCTLISILPLPRMMYALAQDGLIFKVFSKVNERTAVPVIATFTSGALIGLLGMILDLSSLVEMLSIGTLLAYSVVDICVIILRYRVQIQDGSPSTSAPEIEEDVSVDDGQTVLVEQTNRKNKRENTILHSIVIVIILSSLGIAVMLKYTSHMSIDVFVAVVVVLASLIIISCLYLSCWRPQNQEDLSFKTPLVPWLPAIALVFNAYLMVSLSRATWIRLGVWVIIGVFVYFGYGIRHSIEGELKDQEGRKNTDL